MKSSLNLFVFEEKCSDQYPSTHSPYIAYYWVYIAYIIKNYNFTVTLSVTFIDFAEWKVEFQ